jgi:hypothetical protein
MTPEQKAELLKQALPPDQLNVITERGLARSAWTSGQWGYMSYKGIHGHSETISWHEVAGIIHAGLAGERHMEYLVAQTEYRRWQISSGRGHLSEADKAERIVWRDRVSERLRETAWAIIDAAVERYAAPEPLFEMGGL